MALRKPLVIVSGQIQQLQSGDTLNAPIDTPIVINQTLTSNVLPGSIVYADAADSVDLARANASGTTKPIGMSAAAGTAAASGDIIVDGPVVLTTGEWDAIMGTTGGLTAGAEYFLSAATAGMGTGTATTTVGQYVVPLGIALSTTELLLNIDRPILL